MASGMSGTRSRVSFECSICLETLDKPTSLGQCRSNAIGQEDNQLPGPSTGATRPPRGRKVTVTPIREAPVVVTHCGHLFHGLCLENWFSTSGARNCPSCNGLVENNKVFRLFPSSGQVRRENQAAIVANNQSATIHQADVTAHGGNHALPANPLSVGNQGEIANRAVVPGVNIGAASNQAVIPGGNIGAASNQAVIPGGNIGAASNQAVILGGNIGAASNRAVIPGGNIGAASNRAVIPGGNIGAASNQAVIPGGNIGAASNQAVIPGGNIGAASNRAVIPGGNIGAASDQAVIPGGNPANNSGRNCARRRCVDLKEMINFLEADIAELQARILARVEEVVERTEEGGRLERNVAELKAENERLKAELRKRRDQDASKVSNIPHKRRCEQ